MEQVSLRLFRFYPACNVPPVLHTHSSIHHGHCIITAVESVIQQHIYKRTFTACPSSLHNLTVKKNIVTLLNNLQLFIITDMISTFKVSRLKIPCAHKSGKADMIVNKKYYIWMLVDFFAVDCNLSDAS